MMLLPLVGGVLVLGVYVWIRLRQDRYNYRQYTIYNRIQEQLHNAFADEELTWDQFVITMNALRETHNESLRGPRRKTYTIPLFTIKDSMEGTPIHDTTTTAVVPDRPRRRLPRRATRSLPEGQEPDRPARS